MRAYRPLRDPLFLVACVTYCVGRWVLRDAFPGSFASAHLNDLLCIPIWTPLMIAGLQRVGWRPHGDPPTLLEVALPLVALATTFEIVLPNTPWFATFSYADVNDVTWYAFGSLIAAAWWRVAYDV